MTVFPTTRAAAKPTPLPMNLDASKRPPAQLRDPVAGSRGQGSGGREQGVGSQRPSDEEARRSTEDPAPLPPTVVSPADASCHDHPGDGTGQIGGADAESLGSAPARQEFQRRSASIPLLSDQESILLRQKHCGGQEVRSLESQVRAVTDLAGQVIGRYRLLEQIGEGGFAVVYLAQQLEPVERKVAVKVIKAGMDSREIIARFEAERQALALMDHPNIAKVFDAGATESGRPYFVMELVRGLPLTAYCDQQHLSTTERLNLFIKVCNAVQHAHQKGIIHRDLKPSNVLVTWHDGAGVPKVIDFGIAKALGQRLTDKTVFTPFAQMLGTPAYMSPEQAVMSVLDIDTRSDIYSLGVLLYELLAGVTPFDKETLAKVGLDEVRRIIREVEPVKPSTRLATERLAARMAGPRKSKIENLVPRRSAAKAGTSEIDKDLDWIVMKCLEKDRQRRYESAGQLAQDLECHLKHQPVTAAAPSTWYRASKFVRRHQAGLATACTVLVLLVAGILASTWQAVRATRAEHRALTEVTKSQQVADLLKQTFNSVAPSLARVGDTAELKELLGKTARRLRRDWGGQPDIEIEMRKTLGQVYFELGEFAAAEHMYGRALGVATNQAGCSPAETAALLRGLATSLYSQGKLNSADNNLQRALAIYTGLYGESHQKIAQCLGDLATLRELQGALPEAEHLNRLTLAMKLKVFGPENEEAADTYCDLSGLLKRERKLDEAESLGRKCLDMRRKVFGPNGHRVANSFEDLADILALEGRLEEAQEAQQRALALRRRILNGSQPQLATSISFLGHLLWQRNRLVEAEQRFREVIELRMDLPLTDGGADFANLGGVLAELGKLKEAEESLKQALAIAQPLHPECSVQMAAWRCCLTDILEREGSLAEAETLARTNLAYWVSVKLDRWQHSWADFQLGFISLKRSHEAQAESLLQRGYQGLEQREQTIPKADLRRLVAAFQRLVEYYSATGRAAQSAEWERRTAAFVQAAGRKPVAAEVTRR